MQLTSCPQFQLPPTPYSLDSPSITFFIFFFFGADILSNTYRAKSKSSEKCTALNRFFFNWRSLTESQQHKVLPVEKAVLRTYLKVIPRLMDTQSGGSSVQVYVDVYTKIAGRGSGMGVHAGTTELSVTAESAGWVELNITKGVKSLWPPSLNQTQVEVTVLARTDCRKKAPVHFEDPTSVPLLQDRRRRRLSTLQPLLLVYLSDEELREAVINQTATTSGQDDPSSDISNTAGAGEGGEAAAEGRRKRRQASEECHVEDFQIDFHDLNLNYILAPASYNARRCMGSCSHQTLNDHGTLGNNYAKIMASAAYLERIRPGTYPKVPKEPCCVPVRYSSLPLVTPREDSSLMYVVYSHMVVEECGCR